MVRSSCSAEDPGLGRFSEEGNGNPLQYSCLENPMDGRAWQTTVHGVAELDTTELLHFHFWLFSVGGYYKQTSKAALDNHMQVFMWIPVFISLG